MLRGSIGGMGTLGTWIFRELRRTSRDATFHASRLVAASGALVLLWTLASTMEAPQGLLGLQMARRFHLVLCLGMLAAGAWIGAPALLRERTEGTLPLLFLTHLTPTAIVLGTSLGAVLRLGALWMATIPAGLVPLAFGAVGAWDALAVVAFEAGLGVTGLAAGLMAAALVRHPAELPRTAASLALGMAMLGVGVFLGLFLMIRNPPSWAWPITGTAYAASVAAVAWLRGIPLVAQVLRDRLGEPGDEGKAAPAFADEEDVDRVEERVWRRHWSRGEGSRLRGRNPLRWLQLREPGRLPSWWIWMGMVVLGWTAAAVMEHRAVPNDAARRWTVELAGAAVLAAMGVQASRGYRREVASGAMELLLTTGLGDRAFISREARTMAGTMWQPLAVHGLLAWGAWRTGQEWIWPERMAWVALGPWWAGWTGLWISGAVHGPWRAAGATILTLALPWAAAWLMEQELGLGRAWASGTWLVLGLAMLGGVRWHLGRTWRSREFVARQLQPASPP